MSTIDPYEVLGVKRSSTLDEIKSAYRKKALKLHPDRNPNDPSAEESFKRVSLAYSLIGDLDSRKSYDESERIRQSEKSAPFNGFNDVFTSRHGFQNNTTWEDLFGSVAGAGRKPYVIKAKIDVTLKDLFDCARKRFVMDGNSIDFRLPPGIRPGMVVSVPLSNGQELQATISLIPESRYQLQGDDIYTSVRVPVTTALEGGEVTVRTLGSNVKLKVPEMTNSHRKLRVKNYGLPKSDGTSGSMLCEVRIVFDDLTPDRKESLKSYFK